MSMVTQNTHKRKRTRLRAGFRDGNRQRIYVLLSGVEGYPFLEFSRCYSGIAHKDFNGPGVAAVRYIWHINYTFLRIRKDWDRMALIPHARRWHVSQIEVLWINGDISREQCVNIIRQYYAPPKRRT